MLNNHPTIRTQISLIPEIKKAIEAKKRLTGETLSAYLRKAALIHLVAEEEEKKELENLAKAVIGCVSLKQHSEWSTKRKVQSLLRKIRTEWE